MRCLNTFFTNTFKVRIKYLKNLNKTVHCNVCRHFYSRGIGDDFHSVNKRKFEYDPISHMLNTRRVTLCLEDYPVFQPSKEDVKKAQYLFDEEWTVDSLNYTLSDLPNLKDGSTPEIMCLGTHLPLKLYFASRKKYEGRPKANEGMISMIFQIPTLQENEVVANVFNLAHIPSAFRIAWIRKKFVSEEKQFKDCIETFLQGRRNLCRVLVSVSALHGINPVSTLYIEVLEKLRIPYVLVVTDASIRDTLLIKNLAAILEYKKNNTSDCCFQDPFLVDPVQNIGKNKLHAYITEVTGVLKNIKTECRSHF